MAPNLPAYFIDEIRLEIIDQTSYTDNEIYGFARKSISKLAPLLQVDATVINGASVYDYTISDTMDNEYWEVVKWATITSMLDYYKHKIIAEGIGVSISLGSEKIDTKSLLIAVKDLAKDAKDTLKQKILAYNMIKKQGSSVDLYYRGITW